MIEAVTYPITALMLAIGAFTDIKTREVPDWVNYSAIAAGIAVSLLFSIISSTVWPILFSLTGTLVFFAIACAMFYSGQWGGGDSKMLIALGSLLGLEFSFQYPFISLSQIIVSFWVNLLFVGVAYALFWSAFLALRNREKFVLQFRQQAAGIKTGRLAITALFAVAAAFIFLAPEPGIRFAAIGIAATLASGGLIWMFAKSVEKSCMIKQIEPEKLTEGDWIARDVYVNKKYICGPKDLGIEKRQIRQLIRLKQQGKIRKILVKEGIPFVPAFLLSFIFSVSLGNVLLMLLHF